MRIMILFLQREPRKSKHRAAVQPAHQLSVEHRECAQVVEFRAPMMCVIARQLCDEAFGRMSGA
jgi:hypothetical protein